MIESIIQNKNTEIKLISSNMLAVPICLYICFGIYATMVKSCKESKAARLMIRLLISVGLYYAAYLFFLSKRIGISDHIWCSFIGVALISKLFKQIELLPKKAIIGVVIIAIIYQASLVYSLVFTAFHYHTFCDCIKGIAFGVLMDHIIAMICKAINQYIK
jgi:FlaA1/EpsC-like NDP-sugar epimerase